MATRRTTRRVGGSRSTLLIGGAIVALGVVAALSLLGSGGPEIEVLHPAQGEIRESFREPARTRLENTWTVSAQIAGRIGRIDLEPGDRVEEGQVIAEFDRIPLEAALAEAEARVQRLTAQLQLIEDSSVELAELATAQARAESSLDRIRMAEAQIEAARARVARTEKDLARARELVDVGALDPQTLDAREMEAIEARELLEQALADLESQKSNAAADRSVADRIEKQIGRKGLERRQIIAQREEAEAQLERARHDLGLARVVAPVDGVVLERHDRGEKPVSNGTPLLVLGNPDEIEVIADVLTEDALKLNVGDPVDLEELSGESLLTGSVKRIEPQGFTKLSSLGVEQQRVNVIVGLNHPAPGLGVEYRLHARFYTGTREGALIVPRYSVLQAPDQSYYVFVVEKGRLRRRTVKPGLRSDLTIEILEGLEASDLVVASPDSTLEENSSVTPAERPFSVSQTG